MSGSGPLGSASAEGVQRRRVIAGTGLGGLAIAAAGMAVSTRPAQADELADMAYLNFSLNLEYLGAEFYLHALTGTGLNAGQTSGTGLKGTVTAGGPVPFFTPAIKQIVTKLASDEVGHVNFLRQQLGANAIAEPSINLTTSWTTLALAAGLIQPGQVFNPFADEISLLAGAYIIEDVCVTALAGTAGLLTVPANVTAAAGLLGTEAAQAGTIRTLLSYLGQGAVTDAVSALRAKLSGAADDFGTSVSGDAFNFVSNDANGLVFARTTAQVLNIAYGGGASANYGFFPNRVNGSIQ